MFQKDFKKSLSLGEIIERKFEKFIAKIPFLKGVRFSRELQLIGIFCLMFLVILGKLFYVQIIYLKNYF